jgi:DNA topoisomerase-1
LFQYVDHTGETRDVTSSDVNQYLKEISGDDITAKDFGTWHGTVLAALALRAFEKFDSQAGAKKNLRAAIQRVASRLGNTPTVCRKCYIHPEILNTYVEGSLLLQVKEEVETELREHLPGLTPEEVAVLTLLRARLASTLEDRLRASDEFGRPRPQSWPSAKEQPRKPRSVPTSTSRRRLKERPRRD